MLRFFSSVLVLAVVTLMLSAAGAQEPRRESARPEAPREEVRREGARPEAPREEVRREGARPEAPREEVRRESARPEAPREDVRREAPREGARPQPQGELVDRLMNNFGVIILEDLPENVPPFVKEMLEKADTDKNGKVTRRELEIAARQVPQQGGARAVAQPQSGMPIKQRLMETFGKDGVILLENIPESAPAQAKELLKKADTDGDGKVTREELQKLEIPASLQQGGGNPGGAMIDRVMNTFGKDGVIILENLPENVPPMVKETLLKADANKDGKVTREELEKATAQPQQR